MRISWYGYVPPVEAAHLEAERDLADLVAADGHELVLGAVVPAVGGVLGEQERPCAVQSPAASASLLAWSQRSTISSSSSRGNAGIRSRPPRSTGHGWGSTSRRPRPRARSSSGGVSSSTVSTPSFDTAKTARAPRARRPRAPGTGRGRRRSASHGVDVVRARHAAPAHRRLIGGQPGGAGLGELHDHLRVVVAVGVGRLGELERPVPRSSTEKIALSCIMAKAAPTQRWRPAPKGIQLHGLATSSSRGSR